MKSVIDAWLAATGLAGTELIEVDGADTDAARARSRRPTTSAGSPRTC